MKLWRIATSTRSYGADDLSGAGAAKSPGRWNAHGEHVVYAAQSVSLAVLETAAHVDSKGLPLDRFLVEIDVPADAWRRRLEIDVSSLDPSWSAIPAGLVSVTAGSKWLAQGKAVILLVPSVIVPEEAAVLINPAHADAIGIQAKVNRMFEYDRLFRR